MKYAKKVMAACAATALLATMATTSVFAIDSDSTASTNGTAEVKYTVAESYSWTVPADVTFTSTQGINETEDKTATVSVEKNVIPDGKSLNISISSKNGFKVVNSGTSLDYKVVKTGNTTALTNDDVILTVKAGVNTGSQELTFTLSTTTGTAEVAGTYTDTVTYTATVK